MGANEETLTMTDDSRVADVCALLQQRHNQLGMILERCVSAVNRRYVSPETVLHDGDELVFIPPMGGGGIKEEAMEPLVLLTRDPLDRDALVTATTHASVGGIVVFEGVVRNHARGKQIRYLEYEAYEEMAREQILAIIDEARQRWGVEHIAVAHRFGRLEIGEASVIIVVASPHRAEAFDACRYIIDTLKAKVPIWKKEVATDGEEWVEG